MGNLLVAMSGGTTTVINATLAGIIGEARRQPFPGSIYAGVHGLHGVLREDLVDLTHLDEGSLRRLTQTPASGFIGTARLRPLDGQDLARIAEVFAAHDVTDFLNIGGNGTIRQSMCVSRYLDNDVRILSVPKTVDNDFGDEPFNMMYFTPGFPSCVNYWSHKIRIFDQENLGACQHDTVLITQVFGRQIGFLTGAARFADPERRLPMLLLLPEDTQPPMRVLDAIDDLVHREGRAIVVMCHGYRIGDIGPRYGPAGQVMYGSSETSAAYVLSNLCHAHGLAARPCVPGFDQRDEILLACDVDLALAEKLGRLAVRELMHGTSHCLLSIPWQERISAESRLMVSPFDQLGDVTRKMPDEWLAKGAFDVSDAYLEYLKHVMEHMSSAFIIGGEPPKFAARPTQVVRKRLAPWEAEEPADAADPLREAV